MKNININPKILLLIATLFSQSIFASTQSNNVGSSADLLLQNARLARATKMNTHKTDMALRSQKMAKLASQSSERISRIQEDEKKITENLDQLEIDISNERDFHENLVIQLHSDIPEIRAKAQALLEDSEQRMAVMKQQIQLQRAIIEDLQKIAENAKY